jgi:predicted MFS family arabinose efflux permease
VIVSGGSSGRAAARVLRDAFGTPDLRRLQLAWAFTALGHWAHTVVLSVYAYNVGGAAAVGLVALARMAPAALAAPFTSLLGDRRRRRDVLLAATVARCAGRAAAALAIVAGAPLWVVVVITALHTAAGTAYKPAQAALLPSLARSPAQMGAANAVWSAVDNTGFVVGALAGGWAIAALSPQAAFAATGLPLLFAAVLLARIPPDPRPAHRERLEGARAGHELLEGLHTVREQPRLRLLVGVLGATTLVEGAIDVLVVVIALQMLDLGDAGVGYLNSAWGVGGVVGGATALGLLTRGRLAAGVGAGCLMIGGALALIAAWKAAVPVLVLLVVVGAGYALVEVAGVTLLQRLAADDVLARAFGVVETSYYVTTGVGAALAPLVIHALGVQDALLAVAAVLPVLAVARWRALARFEAGVPIPEREFALLRGIPLFAPLPIATVENLARRLVEVRAAPGETIVRQGDVGDRFYVIAEGAVDVVEDGVLRRTEHEGEFFGEIALLRDTPRTATVQARVPTLLLALDRDEFVGGVTGHRRSVQAADVVIDARLAPSGV